MLDKKQRDGNQSEGEDEESKDAKSTIAQSDSETVMINTSAIEPQESNESIEESKGEPQDDIDGILVGSASYDQAVNESQRMTQNASRLQAEPSHFHLAALAQERARRPMKTLADMAN